MSVELTTFRIAATEGDKYQRLNQLGYRSAGKTILPVFLSKVRLSTIFLSLSETFRPLVTVIR